VRPDLQEGTDPIINRVLGFMTVSSSDSKYLLAPQETLQDVSIDSDNDKAIVNLIVDEEALLLSTRVA